MSQHSDPAPRHLRLKSALLSGLELADGAPVAVLRPRAGERFDPLERAQLHLQQGFRPDHDAFARSGYAVSPQMPQGCAAALVCLPRARAAAEGLIAAAAAVPGPVLVDGQKTDGIDSILKALRARVSLSDPVIKGHGKLAWFDADSADLGDWAAQPLRLSDPDATGFITLPGNFSADGVDPGSRLLAQALPAALSGRVVDLGAGWGYLGAQVLRRAGVEALHLVEAEHDALDCARANLHDARVQFHWADARGFTLPKAVDHVVTNPPFHQGRTADPQLGLDFIAAAQRLLAPGGNLWLVSNRHLPYERALAERFSRYEVIAQDRGFRCFHASGPRRMIRAPRPPDRRHRA